MISQKDLNKYGFDNIDIFFAHIISQFYQGNFTRAEFLTIKLSPEQKKQYVNYLIDHYFDTNYLSMTDLKSLIKNLII